jgi:hypothetical protein
LTIAPEKTQVFAPHATEETMQGIRNKIPHSITEDQITTQGLTILGVPIGKDAWMETQLQQIVAKYQEELNQISKSCSTQQKFKILQLAASIFQHIISVLPPMITEKFCTDIDEINIQSFIDTFMPTAQLNQDQRNWMTRRLHLPVRFMGFGILSLQVRRHPAYISTAVALYNGNTLASSNHWQAYQQTQPMLEYFEQAQEEIHKWRINRANIQTMANGQQQVEPTKWTFLQLTEEVMKTWMMPLFHCELQQLYDKASPQQKQLLVAMKDPATRTVLTAWPSRPETRLNNQEMTHAILHRMGIGLKELLGITQESYNNKCWACNRGKANAEHMNSCGATRKQRHDDMVICTKEMLADAGISSMLEKQVGITNQPGQQKKIDLWFRNQAPANTSQQHIMLDVTVIQAFSTTNDTELPQTGKEMKTAADNKRTKYATEAIALSAQVQPMVFTTLGAIHKEVTQFIKGTAKFAQQNQTYYPSVNFDFNVKWRQNFAFQMARSTAKAAYKAFQIHDAALQFATMFDGTVD